MKKYKSINISLEEQLKIILDNTAPYDKPSYIISQFDLNDFLRKIKKYKGFSIIPVAKLYLFKGVMRFNDKELEEHFRNNPRDGFELGFIKDDFQVGFVVIPAKETLNKCIRDLGPKKKARLNKIVKSILEECKKRNINLDERNLDEGVDSYIKNSNKKSPYIITEKLIREKLRLVKYLIGKHFKFDLKCNSKYKRNDILDMLIRAALVTFHCVNGAHEKLRKVDHDYMKPTGRTVMRQTGGLQKTNDPGKEIEEFFNIVVKSMIHFLIMNHTLKLGDISLSYDKTDVPAYCNKNERKYTCGGEHVNSTSHFYTYLFCKIDLIDLEFFIDLIPVFDWDGSTLERLFKRSLERVREIVPVGIIKLDREFSSDHEIYRVFIKLDCKVLMIAKKNVKVHRLVHKCQIVRNQIFENQLAPGSSIKDPVYINVAVVENIDKIKIDEDDDEPHLK